jgi:uncharacterized protein YdeI (YjbR/CyaY-like superfamily)
MHGLATTQMSEVDEMVEANPKDKKPKFFRTPQAFRDWLEKHHACEDVLLVGFYKVGSGKPSMTWPESVDQALCFGWIDGVRKSIDELSYSVRFTPRKAKSTWSSVNIQRVAELTEQKLMHQAGLDAFQRRQSDNSSIYSYEQRDVELPEPYAGILRKKKAASKYFHSQSPSYRKAACWWVISAKKEETRSKRLATLIELSEKEEQIPQFQVRKPPKRK